MRNPAVSHITAETLARWLDLEPPNNEKPEGGYALVDIRPAELFAQWHIAGAENIPLERIALLRRRFAREKVIVVYGAAGDDSDAQDAALDLSAGGFVRIQCLEGGLPAWREAQHRLDRTRRERAGRRRLRSNSRSRGSRSR